MNMESIRDVLVQYGPWAVISVAVIALGLTAVVFATFLLNELFFKRKEAHAEHGHDPVDPATLDHALARLLAEDPHLEGDDARGFRHVVARVKRGLRFEAAG